MKASKCILVPDTLHVVPPLDCEMPVPNVHHIKNGSKSRAVDSRVQPSRKHPGNVMSMDEHVNAANSHAEHQLLVLIPSTVPTISQSLMQKGLSGSSASVGTHVDAVEGGSSQDNVWGTPCNFHYAGGVIFGHFDLVRCRLLRQTLNTVIGSLLLS